MDNTVKPQGDADELQLTVTIDELHDEKNKTTANSEAANIPPAEKLSDMEVMEHTASMWQYKEITDDGTEMHSELHVKHSKSQKGEIIGARVRGKKHKHEGSNCDDYFESAVTDDCFVAAVCDGAGSRKLSRIGSRVSCETAVGFMKERLAEEFSGELKKGLCAELSSEEFLSACGKIANILHDAAKKAFCAQQQELAGIIEDENYKAALGRAPEIGDLASTFLAAVAVPVEVNGTAQTFVACVQIGDGCVCALDSKADADACLKIMGDADSGAFSGETDFLSEKTTSDDALAKKTKISRGSSDTVFLMSDGVADDYFPAVMMKRLFIDLQLNGILDYSCGKEGISPEDPAPIRFRSVSLSKKSVALQYSKQLLANDKSEKNVNALWNKKEALYCHSLEAFGMNVGETPEERLGVWLDNYNERGSFDDRTLVIIKLNY